MQGFDPTQFIGSGGNSPLANASALENIQPPDIQQAVLNAYANSLRVIWIVAAPIAAFGLACSLIIKVYSMTNKGHATMDPEKDAHSQDATMTQIDPQADLQHSQDGIPRTV